MDKMILYEDDVLIVVHKPQKIATQTAHIGQKDLVSELRNYRNSKGEDSYIGLVHRLDQPVEGLLVFAKTSSAAANLSRQLDTGVLKKQYVAFVDGIVDEGSIELTDYLLKDTHTNLSRVVKKGTSNAKKAVLKYHSIKTCTKTPFSISIIEVELFTGRHHQIRVQLSNAGFPLLGDMKYGTIHSKQVSDQIGIKSTALLAHRLIFKHPVKNRNMDFSINYEEAEFWRNSTILSEAVL